MDPTVPAPTSDFQRRLELDTEVNYRAMGLQKGVMAAMDEAKRNPDSVEKMDFWRRRYQVLQQHCFANTGRMWNPYGIGVLEPPTAVPAPADQEQE